MENILCYVLSNISFLDVFVPLGESSSYDRICLCTYGLLTRILSDEELKEMKVTKKMCDFFLNMLEQAWHHPSKKYKQIPIFYLFRGK